jgi:hypothetical protein
LAHEELSVVHDNLAQEHALLTKKFSNEETKTSESSSFGSNDQSHITNPCDVREKHVSTSYDDLLDMPCSSHIDTCSTSMTCETNLLKENNELKKEVKNLSNKLERCYNSKVTFEHMLNNKISYGDMSGIGFNKSNIKGKRWGKRRYEREMKKQEQEKLSYFMCFKCHKMGHLANGCPNEEKLKLKKEEERLKHVKCFKCRTWGYLTSMCLTKKLVKQ